MDFKLQFLVNFLIYTDSIYQLITNKYKYEFPICFTLLFFKDKE